ncbi:MAG TPA: type II secretion system F family protein [Lacipirellulaceae bacterium]|nr:type II secretion system F family protein [Lacipirellulaceae bacterium]
MNAPRGGGDSDLGTARRKAAVADFITLNEEIAALARARLPLETHLRRFGADLSGKAGELVERIGRRLESGDSLAAAMDRECAELPAAYRAAILAGVQSGQLADALESLVDTATRLDQLRRISGLALIYPLMIAAVTCQLLAFVISSVVPTFDWLNRPHFGPLRRLSDWPYTVPILAVGVPCVLLLAALDWWRRTGRVGGMGTMRPGPFGWLPGIANVRRWSQAATFADLLVLLVERGLPLDDSLCLAAEATGNRRFRNRAERVANEIRQGRAIQAHGAEPGGAKNSEFPLLIRLAMHHRGDRALLAGSLRQASSIYRERAIRAAEWYAEYFPILVVAGIGGTLTMGFTLLVLWPYAATLNELAGWNWR